MSSQFGLMREKRFRPFFFTLFFGAEDACSNWHPCRFAYHGVDISYRWSSS